MKIIIAAAMLAAAIPGAVLAQPDAGKAAKADKKICRSDTPTGSIMPRSICHTRAEWEAIDAANQADAQGGFDRQNRVGGQAGH